MKSKRSIKIINILAKLICFILLAAGVELSYAKYEDVNQINKNTTTDLSTDDFKIDHKCVGKICSFKLKIKDQSKGKVSSVNWSINKRQGFKDTYNEKDDKFDREVTVIDNGNGYYATAKQISLYGLDKCGGNKNSCSETSNPTAYVFLDGGLGKSVKHIKVTVNKKYSINKTITLDYSLVLNRGHMFLQRKKNDDDGILSALPIYKHFPEGEGLVMWRDRPYGLEEIICGDGYTVPAAVPVNYEHNNVPDVIPHSPYMNHPGYMKLAKSGDNYYKLRPIPGYKVGAAIVLSIRYDYKTSWMFWGDKEVTYSVSKKNLYSDLKAINIPYDDNSNKGKVIMEVPCVPIADYYKYYIYSPYDDS